MRKVVDVGVIWAAIAFVAMAVPLVHGQIPVARSGANAEPVKPHPPGGMLSDQLGEYRTVEGFNSEGAKVETGMLLVDTVDGKKLDKPIPIVIRSAVVVDHNLKQFVLSLPPKQRCILKGFESGEMIGVPPAVSAAAEEQGWRDVPMSPTLWRWRPYFIALVVIEPKDLELGGVMKTRGDESKISESRPVSRQVCAKLEALFQQHYPKATFDNQGVNGIHFEQEVVTFKFPYILAPRA